MAGNLIVVVNFSIAPEKEAEFTEFYHHRYLPALLAQVPAIRTIRRYEELGIGGTLRWYNKQFLTIYSLASDVTSSGVEEFFTRLSPQEVMIELMQWKANALRNFTSMAYEETWSHERGAEAGPFRGGPFFLWSLEMRPELDEPFQRWYEEDYLPLQVADIPTWSGVHRFRSVNREQVRHLTFFEAAGEEALVRCLTDLRAPHRISQNYEWQKRVEPATLWHDATSFRPIYRRPG